LDLLEQQAGTLPATQRKRIAERLQALGEVLTPVHQGWQGGRGNDWPAGQQTAFQAQLLNAVRQAIIATDLEGNVIYWNDFAQQLYGWSAPEVLGRNILEITPAEGMEAQAVEIMGRIHQGESWSGEFQVQRRDGTSFPAVVTDSPIYDAGGQLIGIIGVSYDVTERKEARKRISNILESISDGFFALDHDLTITYFNQAAEKWLGRESEEVLGEYLFDAFPQARGTIFEEKYTWALKEKQAVSFETYFGAKPYENWYHVRVYPYQDGISVYFQVTTERKQAEEALRRSESKFRILFNHANDAIFIHNLRGRFLEVNQVACERLGYSRAELLKMTPLDIDAPEYARQVPERMARVWWEGHGILETAHVRRDGTVIPVELSSRVIDYQGKPAILSIARDITQRKQAEEILAQQTQELARSNAELEQFAYIVSHDLREPLRMVTKYLELLTRRYGEHLDPKAGEFIDQAADGAYRMQDMIGGLLEYARAGTRDRQVGLVDSQAVLERVLADLELAIENQLAVVTYDALPQVYADPVELARVFQNLISNAIKFHSHARPRIDIAVQKGPAEWVFSVQDNGIGIDPDQADQVFGLFQRLNGRERYAGTGVGLAICKKTVERHGGRIWFESEPGTGSTFYFTVPRIERSPLREQQAQEKGNETAPHASLRRFE
jgi:PAS domain S-box-containing protein